ncbi:MAG TPA: YceI family protein [Saprospiraceae bacterium]|nr:YceI family protein [Saprospiraceae bacterium]
MYKYLILFIFILSASLVDAQKYFSKTGSIYFLSEAPIEKIEANNGNAYVVYDASSGSMEWSVLIKGFKFAKAMMQQHFNENYMDSDKYPKATFKGKVISPSGINFSKDGKYNVDVSGDLTIHGVTKPFRGPGHVTIKEDKRTMDASFVVTIDEFAIQVPKVVRENIAKTVKVSVHADLQSLK